MKSDGVNKVMTKDFETKASYRAFEGLTGKVNSMIKRQGNGNGVCRKALLSWSAALSFTTLLLVGCDAVHQDQLPVGATMSIAPSERTLTIDAFTDEEGTCFIDPDRYIDWPIVMALTTSDGAPIAHQDVRVYVDYGANTFSGYPVMALYDDRQGNSNGVVDDFELVNDTDDDIAIVKTDRYGGDRELLLRINISCPFRGEVFAFVDGVSAMSTIEVVAREEESFVTGSGL